MTGVHLGAGAVLIFSDLCVQVICGNVLAKAEFKIYSFVQQDSYQVKMAPFIVMGLLCNANVF